MLTFVLRHLTDLQARNLATIAGIMISVASLVALVGLARGVASTLLDSLDVRGTDAVITEAGALDLMSSIVPTGFAAEIAARPGVAAATPELARMTSLPDGRAVMALGWPAQAFPWQGLDLVEGRLPVPGDSLIAVVGDDLAERAGLRLGDTVTLFQTDFSVVGFVDAAAILSRNLIYVPLPAMQEITYRDGQATSILVQLAPGSPRAQDEVLAELRASYESLSVEPSENLVDHYAYGRIANVLSLSISAVALLSAVLIIYNTMSMAVSERRSEIAIMAAVGWARWRIVALIVGESVAFSVLGGVLGCGLGVVSARLVVKAPSIAGFIAPQFSTGLIVWALVLSVVMGLAGALVPALGATARSPADVLRGR